MTSQLHITATYNGTKTILDNVFFTSPYKVADVTLNKSKSTLELMIMSSSPGIMDGDEHHTKIELNENSKVIIKSQAYQRLFPMQTGANYFTEIHLNHHSDLQYIQKPIVPQANSIYNQHQKIYCKANSKLILGEIITCGRKLNGEQFSFSKFHSVTDIYIDETLALKENVLIEPVKIACSSFGELEEFSHQSTLFCFLPNADAKLIRQQLLELSSFKPNMCIGFTWPQENLLVIRNLCHQAEEAYNLQNEIAEILSLEIKKENDVLKNGFAN